MTADELQQLIHLIKSIRQINPLSSIARRLELQICGELLLVAGTTEGLADSILPGVARENAKTYLFGVIHGRPNDPGQPWVLRL